MKRTVTMKLIVRLESTKAQCPDADVMPHSIRHSPLPILSQLWALGGFCSLPADRSCSCLTPINYRVHNSASSLSIVTKYRCSIDKWDGVFKVTALRLCGGWKTINVQQFGGRILFDIGESFGLLCNTWWANTSEYDPTWQNVIKSRRLYTK